MSSKKPTPKEYYVSTSTYLSACIRRLVKRGRLFIAAEIMSFVLAIAFVVAYAVYGWGGIALFLAFVSFVAYFLTRRADELTDIKISIHKAQLSVCENELAYLRGDFSCFDDGVRYVDSNHPYTFDIDVFGPQSLFNRIDRTVTTGGSDQLASWLRYPDTDHTDDYAEAIETLSAATDWRRDFIAYGVNGKIDTVAVTNALHTVSSLKVRPWVATKVALDVAIAMVICLFVLIYLSVFNDLPSSAPVLWGLAMLGLCISLCHGKLMRISRAVDKLQKQTAGYIRIVRHICRLEERLKKEGNEKKALSALVAVVSEALSSFEEIGKILDSLDRRGNKLGLILSDVFFLSDFFRLRRFVKWQNRYMAKIDERMVAISRVDALVSMATMRYNEPSAMRAEIVDGGDNIVYEARNLRHPFIGAKAVGNDFRIDDSNYYIITGANMAGKSTFLRSVGINWLLAMCGMPVFADSLRLSVFPLFTSMRTSDDLSRGISYFNAELLRLKQLINYQSGHPGTLIILDEILKGTNSADKLSGSRLFLEYMSQRHATCIVATHDLELSRLADSRPQRFHNYCFEIELGASVTYTYRITEGVARNQNATFLLRRLLNENISG